MPATAPSAPAAMQTLSLFLALGSMLGLARLMGELVRRFRQPAILGEILAGVILGPTVLGRLQPGWYHFMFPAAGVGDGGSNAAILDGLTLLALTLFLFVAGMEIDLSRIWRQGLTALTVSVSGIIIPFTCSFIPAFFVPRWLGGEPGTQHLIFALVFATALSISALPVIAKLMMDLNLYRTDVGMVTMAAAIVDDLSGWIIFAVVLGLVGADGGHAPPIVHTILLTLGYTAAMLTLGRWLIHRSLPWIQAHLSWPGGVIGLTLVLALFGAAFTDWIGVHAMFGAFIVGVAVGDSPHLRAETRRTLAQFISFFFAPLFFASLGLRADFISQFDWELVLLVLLLACAGKLLGCGLAARVTGMDKRESWAVGIAMNSRGAMEMVLGLLALQTHLISPRLFVALVIMAIVTSLMSGPVLERIIARPKTRRFVDFLSGRGFLPRLQSAQRAGVIWEMAQAVAPLTRHSADTIRQAVLHREDMMATGLINGIAVPHARLSDLDKPVVAVGISESGVDFEAADGRPAHLIFLVLTPLHNHGAQLEILADIAATFRVPKAPAQVARAASYTEFLALLRSEVNDEGQSDLAE